MTETSRTPPPVPRGAGCHRDAHSGQMVEKVGELLDRANHWCLICSAEMMLIGVLPRTAQSSQEAVFLCTRCDYVERQQH